MFRPLVCVVAFASCATSLAPCGGSNVALVTPMVGGSNAVDFGALRQLLEWHVDCGPAGIVALGTTGEASTLSSAERDEVRVLSLPADARARPRFRRAVVATAGAPRPLFASRSCGRRSRSAAGRCR